MQTESQGAIGQDLKKKNYVAPKLVEYGSIAKLTQNGGVTVADVDAMLQVCL